MQVRFGIIFVLFSTPCHSCDLPDLPRFCFASVGRENAGPAVEISSESVVNVDVGLGYRFRCVWFCYVWLYRKGSCHSSF